MLDKLTVADFTACLDSVFVLQLQDQQGIDLELIEAVPWGNATQGGRAPFSILFRGPVDRAVEQGSYALRHETMGELLLFLVPVGADENGVRYEAIFN